MASMDPTAGVDPQDIDPRDVDSEAVVDELDVDTEAPLDEVTPPQPDSERIVPEPEEPAPGE